MNRGAGLPKGLANLGDTVRVVGRDGADLGLMIVAEAQKLASDQGARLFVTDPTATPPDVIIVDVRKLWALLKQEVRRVSK
jgi:translation initiation factor IF-3